MSTSQKIRDLLKLFPDIKPKEASIKLEIPYTKSFCNTFYSVKKVPQKIPQTTKNRVLNKIPSNSSNSPRTAGSVAPAIVALPEYKNINVKDLIKRASIDAIIKDKRIAGQALQILSKEEFINQSEVKHNVFWNADIPPYKRPEWVYDWQSVGIDLMKNGHCMWQAGRQKIGKTTGAGIADFEEMLEKPGTVITLVAPTQDLAKTLLYQMFKEVLTLDSGKKFDLWNQLFKPYFITDNALTKVLKNGSRIQVITLDYKAVQGIASDVIHIEEIDKAVREPQKLEALAGLFPQIRARKGFAKIRITCNNASGVYRILRDELKQFGQYFPIYMEKPRPRDQAFTGEHFIYNDHITLTKKPDVDEILEVLMDVMMGQGYTQMQLYNMDSYEGDLFNPDKVSLAYSKEVPNKTRFEHSAMGIDPGAVHAFAVTVYGMDGDQIFHLATKRWSLSEIPEKEYENVLDQITTECAYLYVKYHCEICASESNSGAKLIIPAIGKKVKDLLEKMHGNSFAMWREIWSNFAGDTENIPNSKRVERADYITLLQYAFLYEKIALQDRNTDEHIQRMEFARYDPTELKEKMKGDCVDSTMHCLWWMCGGRKYINKLIGKSEKVKIYAL
jgi:hypothetical protein